MNDAIFVDEDLIWSDIGVSRSKEFPRGEY